MLSLLLNKFGFEVSAYESIAEAGSAIEDNNYSLALIDLNLKDGSGFDLIKKINEKSDNCEVVIITAYDSEDERNKAESLAVKHFISKPFNKRILQAKLKLLGFEL